MNIDIERAKLGLQRIYLCLFPQTIQLTLQHLFDLPCKRLWDDLKNKQIINLILIIAL